jgi:hypothetical protein
MTDATVCGAKRDLCAAALQLGPADLATFTLLDVAP